MVSVLPYVPEEITVHLGAPDEEADNVRLPYLDYLKNVAASEIYPTWAQSAIRANLLAINSYALNRVYTEYYRSRGYAFDITNTTAYDQSFVAGRSTFETTDIMAESLMDTYIRRLGHIEPLAAKFCNGTTSTCNGLSQWGSQALAEEGKNSVEILQTYYGNDIELVTGAPVKPITPSYGGTPLKLGSYGDDVTILQTSLNRISQNYPAIPKINPVDGYYSGTTEEAVRQFQEIFGLEVDGIVGEATWYAVVQAYVAVKQLAELQSEGQTVAAIPAAFPGNLELGSSGESVSKLQYMLNVVSAFRPIVPKSSQSGTYDASTDSAVSAYQRSEQLPVSGTVDEATWYALHRSYEAIDRTVFRDALLFRVPPLEHAEDADEQGRRLDALASAFPSMTKSGDCAETKMQAIRDFQHIFGLPQSGVFDEATEDAVRRQCEDLRFSATPRPRQFCGYTLTFGMRDTPVSEMQRRNPRIADCDQPILNLQRLLCCVQNESPNLHPDGIFGESTRSAVAEFQTSVGLPQTGAVNLATWNALLAYCPDALSSPPQFSSCP